MFVILHCFCCNFFLIAFHHISYISGYFAHNNCGPRNGVRIILYINYAYMHYPVLEQSDSLIEELADYCAHIPSYQECSLLICWCRIFIDHDQISAAESV